MVPGVAHAHAGVGARVMTRPAPQVEVKRLAYSLSETADALSVSNHTIQRAISFGLLRCTRIGMAIRVPATEVERLARDGLPELPRGYKRKTAGETKQGRKRKRR